MLTWYSIGQHHPLTNIDIPDEGKADTSAKMPKGNAEMESQVIQWGNHEVVSWLKTTGNVK